MPLIFFHLRLILVGKSLSLGRLSETGHSVNVSSLEDSAEPDSRIRFLGLDAVEQQEKVPEPLPEQLPEQVPENSSEATPCQAPAPGGPYSFRGAYR